MAGLKLRPVCRAALESTPGTEIALRLSCVVLECPWSTSSAHGLVRLILELTSLTCSALCHNVCGAPCIEQIRVGHIVVLSCSTRLACVHRTRHITERTSTTSIRVALIVQYCHAHAHIRDRRRVRHESHYSRSCPLISFIVDSLQPNQLWFCAI